jgi:multicomponent Na+:H+ antiporter subunit E
MLDRSEPFEAMTSGPPLHAPTPSVRQAAPAVPVPRGGRRARVASVARSGVLLALLWTALTGGEPASWAIGAPAVAAGAAIAFLLPPAASWRLSPTGALVFVGWFAAQSLRGAVDVARRALDPRLPLRPGFRSFETGLPPGPARIVMINTITLLPGTLTAGIRGDRLIVHMLDTRADLARELAAVEARVRALFALPATQPSKPETRP